MRVLEAKDFLVRETAEQASLEGVPLSALEKRMMYFTESGEVPEDPIKLNDEFEAEYDSAEYEAKIARLLIHAYRRLKKENPETARSWDAAIRELRKGDHYILVMWGQRSSVERPPHDFLKLLGASLLVVVVGMALMIFLLELSDRYNIHWNSGPHTHKSVPAWFQRSILAFMLGGYVYYVVLPWVFKRPAIGIGQLLMKLLRAKTEDNPEK
jgi:hypothetical protein